MRMLTFAGRNTKEILRDPLTLLFGLGFPLILLLLLSAIQANIPVILFEIQSLAPGITVFGLSFITLFSATVLAKDRGSSLLQRLYTTPLTPADFILGYTLPILPMALAQTALCYAVALLLGLDLTLKEVDSTNNYLRSLPADEVKNEIVVAVAKKQTAGRGQRGNSWEHHF